MRLIIVSYLCQTCCVKWENCNSGLFTACNGVRQGAVASPLYFNAYLDDLFVEMKASGFGCYIDDLFYGLLGYADDCALLSPSREGLQKMLNICIKYFQDHGIKISVNVIESKSKTKCLAFNSTLNPAKLSLYNLSLPWVTSAVHLGHIVSTEDDAKDILSRRGEFISNVHQLQQELGDQHPDVFMRLVQIYLSSMYGSNLWNLFSNSAEKLFVSWNVLLKTIFKLPYATHRYILYNICDIPHLRISLFKRFAKFYTKLENCMKPEITHLFHLQKSDPRSVFGSNCFSMCREWGVSPLNTVNLSDIKMPLSLPVDEEWRMNFIFDLLTVPDIPKCEIDYMLNFICCN